MYHYQIKCLALNEAVETKPFYSLNPEFQEFLSNALVRYNVDLWDSALILTLLDIGFFKKQSVNKSGFVQDA